ncbi:MAG: nif-specific transcriptional activator NifA [Rhodospirillaceae bacterium]|nr:nif-specific transcriptional activator NifA [Rhodospirillaceae bacterium]
MPSVRQANALSLVSLYEISKMLTASANLEATLRAVLNLLSGYMEMRRGVVALTGDDGQLHVVAAAGMTVRDMNAGAANLPGDVGAHILSGDMPMVAEDVAEMPSLASYLGASNVLEDERVSFIGVPIRTFGKPFGVLAIARVWGEETAVSFGDDVRFLTMVANLVAQTVKLHEKIDTERELRPRDLDTPRRRPRPPAEARQLKSVIGTSQAMQEVYAQVHLVAPTKSTVMLRGESGTGKELIARAVHSLSPRTNGPFVKVNCAALPETLLESELFGHEKGAFTGATQDRKGRFEMAHGGTLFLDEIGDITPAFQAKLLRVLQEREFERVGGNKTIQVDVRLVCATNRNLEEAVARGSFRADLYYRINVIPVFLPALRERRDDIPLLAQHFLDAFNEENARTLRFSDHAFRVLKSCSFPGNVRELENCVSRVATMTVGELIDDINLPCQTNRCPCNLLLPTDPGLPARAEPVRPQPVGADTGHAANGTATNGHAANGGGADVAADGFGLDDLGDLSALPPRDRLVRVMEKSGWVQAKAARLLGMTPRQVGYALRKYNIEIKRL